MQWRNETKTQKDAYRFRAAHQSYAQKQVELLQSPQAQPTCTEQGQGWHITKTRPKNYNSPHSQQGVMPNKVFVNHHCWW